MSEIEKYEYGNYTLAQCCQTCDYAHNPYYFKIDICPKCGGDVDYERGRWKQAVSRNSWFQAYIMDMGRISRTPVSFLKKKDEKLPRPDPSEFVLS